MWRASSKAGLAIAMLVITGCASGPQVVPGDQESQVMAPDPELQEAYAEALADMDAGDFDAAMKRLNQLSMVAPHLAGPHLNRGLIYSQAGEFEQALLAFEQAAAAAPDAPIAHNEMGIIYRRQGRFDESEAAYLRAVAADPGYAKAWHNLALLCDLYRGDATQALEYAQRYQSLAPADEEREVKRWLADLNRRAAVQVAAREEDTR